MQSLEGSPGTTLSPQILNTQTSNPKVTQKSSQNLKPLIASLPKAPRSPNLGLASQHGQRQLPCPGPERVLLPFDAGFSVELWGLDNFRMLPSASVSRVSGLTLGWPGL